ncbi:MAG: hypothetical protein ABI838_10190 [Chloroflexota bacterium]
MRWFVVVGSALAGVLLASSGAFAADGDQVWLQPADKAGTSPVGEARVGCEAITVWAQGDAAGDGTWAALPVSAAADSGAHSVLGAWSYAGGPAAQVAEVGGLAAGRYRFVLYGALARERVVTVECNRGPAPVYAPVMKGAPLAVPLVATGSSQPAAGSATGDTVPVAELTTVPAPAPPSGLTDSPLVLGLLVGLLLSIVVVGWSFARR